MSFWVDMGLARACMVWSEEGHLTPRNDCGIHNNNSKNERPRAPHALSRSHNAQARWRSGGAPPLRRGLNCSRKLKRTYVFGLTLGLTHA